LSRSEVIFTFIQYEIRRAIARKKVLALVAFTILLGTLPYYALSAAGATLIPNSTYPYIWAVGIFAVGPLFLNFTAILIAAGAMSEEYEQGTAELLLSKPVRRSDYFVGCKAKRLLCGQVSRGLHSFPFYTYTQYVSLCRLRIHFLWDSKQPIHHPRALFSPSLLFIVILFSCFHGWRINQKILAGIHILLSCLLFKLYHKHIYGFNLHSHRQRNL